jgi:hypothetical protein
MINKDTCFWCLEKYEKKPKANKQYFCSRDCKEAHWRARNAQKLRKYHAEYRKNNVEAVRGAKRKWNNKNKDYRRLWYTSNSNIVKTSQMLSSRPEMRSRQQAKRIVKKLGWERICSSCSATIDIHLHHIDGNPLNNSIDNFIYLCRKHHMEEHSRINQDKLYTVK